MKGLSFTRTITVLLTVLSLTFFTLQLPAHAAGSMEVNIIDVGQADSIYVKLPNGENMVVDGGNNDDGSLVVNYLQSNGVSRVEYVVGTHPHEDHIGGLYPGVVAKYPLACKYFVSDALDIQWSNPLFYKMLYKYIFVR